MKRKKRKNMMVLVGLIIGVTGITVAFAALSTTLTITGTATMDTASWEVKFANLAGPTLTGDASVVTPPTLTDTNVGTFDVTVTKPADAVEYTFDVTNTGDLAAEIGTFTDASPVCSGLSGADETLVCSNLNYELTYTSGGAPVALADTLASLETKNLTLKLEYDPGGTLPDDDVDITGLGITIIYVEQ